MANDQPSKWHSVAAFESWPDAPDRSLEFVNDLIHQCNVPSTPYEADHGNRAILVSVRSLRRIQNQSTQTKGELPDNGGGALIVGAASSEPVEDLIQMINPSSRGPDSSLVVAIAGSPKTTTDVAGLVGPSFHSASIGSLSFSVGERSPLVLHLFKLVPKKDAFQRLLQNPAKKVGEPADNLEGRSRWFKQRQGDDS